MAWTAPMTAAFNSTFTSAQYNTYVRDNLLETAPAKATLSGGYFVANGANSIIQRSASSQYVGANESTSSTSFVDLTTVGPTLTLTTGTKVLVGFEAQIANSNTNSQSLAAVEVSGATTIAADYPTAITTMGNVANQMNLQGATIVLNVNAGSNTFKMKYRASSGTASFRRRMMFVMPF